MITRTGPTVIALNTAAAPSRWSATLKDFPGKRDNDLLALADHADLAIYDATFTEEEIVSRADWGHSTWARGVLRMANEAGVKHLCLFHHDPSHDDDFMDRMAAEANDVRPGTIVAREGQIIDL